MARTRQIILSGCYIVAAGLFQACTETGSSARAAAATPTPTPTPTPKGAKKKYSGPSGFHSKDHGGCEQMHMEQEKGKRTAFFYCDKCKKGLHFNPKHLKRLELEDGKGGVAAKTKRTFFGRKKKEGDDVTDAVLVRRENGKRNVFNRVMHLGQAYDKKEIMIPWVWMALPTHNLPRGLQQDSQICKPCASTETVRFAIPKNAMLYRKFGENENIENTADANEAIRVDLNSIDPPVTKHNEKFKVCKA